MTLRELSALAEDGHSIRIDFQKRTLLVDGHVQEVTISPMPLEYVLEGIEDLYHEYKYSLPSEYSDGKRKSYFKALQANDMTDEELCSGKPREQARVELEGFILACLRNGSLHWTNEMGSWFWQGRDKDLVVLKNWIGDNES